MLTIAPLLGGLHRRQNGASDKPSRFQIDGEHVLPVLFRHRDRIGVDVASGVVDEPGHGPELPRRRVERLRDVAGAPHVAGAEMRAVLRAKRDEEIAPRRLLEIDDRYKRALRERLGGDRRADAASPAGHQDMLSLDSSGHRLTRA